MKLEYFGHSFWGITTEEYKVVIDPFDNIGYPMPQNLEADYIFISHEHHDHNNVSIVKGNPQIIRTPGLYKLPGIVAELLSAFHDDVRGAKRGKNNIIKLEIDNITFVHCGDLGHVPEQDILTKLYKPDILFIPVGEVYTLSLSDVRILIDKLQPKLIFPMHYKTSFLSFNLGSLEAFLRDKSKVVYIKENTLEITKDLFDDSKTIVLNQAQ